MSGHERPLRYADEAAEAARAFRKKTSQRRVMGGNISSVAEVRTRINDRTDEEAAMEARRAEKSQKRSKHGTDNSAAVAVKRSKQNSRQYEQIIEFKDRIADLVETRSIAPLCSIALLSTSTWRLVRGTVTLYSAENRIGSSAAL
jgi:hypothetical protein